MRAGTWVDTWVPIMSDRNGDLVNGLPVVPSEVLIRGCVEAPLAVPNRHQVGGNDGGGEASVHAEPFHQRNPREPS